MRFVGSLLAIVAAMLVPSGVTAQGAYRLAVFYVVPSDIQYEPLVHERLIDATRDMQAWYQCASGGLTWQLAFPEAVRVYAGDQTREYYRDHGDWWGSLLEEMASKGLPIWSTGTVTAIWARGAGWWAGAAPSCGLQCGVALFGVEGFPEFNNPAWSGGVCPGGVGGAAWPCTPVGAFAHELGHTLGLPHPFDVAETRADAFHSLMQTHWNYPTHAPPEESPWGFLTLERQAIRTSPFMHQRVDLVQRHPTCAAVNLPPAGPAPVADFTVRADGLSISLTDRSAGATLWYWTFGDGAVSNDANPVHAYARPGTYTVELRVSSADAMVAVARKSVAVGGGPVVSRFTGTATGVGGGPDRGGTQIVGRFTSPADVNLGASTITIVKLLDEEEGGGELVRGLPLVLSPIPGSRVDLARFEDRTRPNFTFFDIRDVGRGEFNFRIKVGVATISSPELCSSTRLTMSFEIDDGVHPPVVVSTQHPWICFGAGDKYMKTR
jgi:hypothetical protein